jgi:AraC family transcriptional regulator, regulatory protein of adaptative response / DNA-3-methyladenine glycosylase II
VGWGRLTTVRSGAFHRVVVELAAPAPYAPDAALGHVVATAVPGCEEVRDGACRRTLRCVAGPAIIAVSPSASGARCTLLLSGPGDEPAALAACRRVLDLDDRPGHRGRGSQHPVDDPDAVARRLSEDPLLRPVVERSPGQRLPRSVDAEELAVRAVLGQQVSTAAARTLAARLLLAHGTHLTGALADPEGGLTHLWPDVDRLAALDARTIAMPRSRQRTFSGLVHALAEGRLRLGPGADVPAARATLADLPGIGPWTVELVALRGLGDPDAFPASDLGVRRAAERLGLPPTPAALLRHAERWRPYRAYAVQYLWSTLDHDVNRDWRQGSTGGAA